MPQEAIYQQEDQLPQVGGVHLVLRAPGSRGCQTGEDSDLPRLGGRRGNPKSGPSHVREAVRLSLISDIPIKDLSPDEDVHHHLQKNLPYQKKPHHRRDLPRQGDLHLGRNLHRQEDLPCRRTPATGRILTSLEDVDQEEDSTTIGLPERRCTRNLGSPVIWD